MNQHRLKAQKRPHFSFLLLAAGMLALNPLTAEAAQPQVGQPAPNFSLSTVSGKKIELSDETARGPVVLVVLRGFPGYQCPFCNQQVQNLIQNQQAFADAGVRVVLVYPGPPENLPQEASVLLADKQLPQHFNLVLDPGYEFTKLYGLRWDAPHETAYPSTFLIDRQGIIFFSKIVKEHGARTKAPEILEALPKPAALTGK